MADTTPPPPGQGPAPEPKHAGLFGKHEHEAPAAGMADMSNQMNNLSRRLRVLEERYTNLKKDAQLTEQGLLKTTKDMNREIQTIHSDLVDFRREFLDLKDKVKLIVKELKSCAKTDEVQTLQKYIDMWEPINFVTRNELDKMIQEAVLAEMEDLNIRLQEERYIKDQIKLALQEEKLASQGKKK
jgi:hypothetical protein